MPTEPAPAPVNILLPTAAPAATPAPPTKAQLMAACRASRLRVHREGYAQLKAMFERAVSFVPLSPEGAKNDLGLTRAEATAAMQPAEQAQIVSDGAQLLALIAGRCPEDPWLHTPLITAWRQALGVSLPGETVPPAPAAA